MGKKISRTDILRKVQEIEKQVNVGLGYVKQLEDDKVKIIIPLENAISGLKYIERNI